MQKTNQKRSIFPLFLYICPEPVAIKDQAMANGTLIHQWDFHAGDTQIWDIELYTGGPYYTISSTATTTPCYLGVENDSSAEYASVILRSGTVTDGMLWDISCNVRSGGFLLSPKVGLSSNRVLGIENYSDYDLDGLTAELHTDDSAGGLCLDEWVLHPVGQIRGTLNLAIKVDGGYTARFTNYTTRISEIMQQVKKFYL